MPDLIESQIRAGLEPEARSTLAEFEAQAQRTGRRWALAAAARCRGLLAPPETADAIFAEAHRLVCALPSPFERARTELCWGERLRRDGRRVDARRHLHDAHQRFEALGAAPWAEKAARELRSSGGRAQRGPRARSDELTAAAAADRDDGRRGPDEQEHRELALSQPEDDRVPPRPRLPQAGRQQPHPARTLAADLLRRLSTRDFPGARAPLAREAITARVVGRDRRPCLQRGDSMTFQRSIRTVLAVACSGSRSSASPPTPAPPTRRRTRSRRTSTMPGSIRRAGQNLVWLAPDGPAGREAARVPAGGGATNLPTEFAGDRAARADASAITRSSSRTATRRRSGGRRPGAGSSVDPPDSPPNCAINARMEILDGRGRIDRRQRRSGEQHREPADKAAPAPRQRPTPARAGRSSSTPARARSGLRP